MPTESALKNLSKILQEFLKVIKVISVYPENNPIPEKLKDSFSGRFIDLVEDIGPIYLKIRDDEICYEKEIVFKDKSQDENLAALFYKAGLTEMAFNRNFDYDSITTLLDVLRGYINKSEGSVDLVAKLWEANISGFEYVTLEDVMYYDYDAQFVVHNSLDSEETFMNRGDDEPADKVNDRYSTIFHAPEPGLDVSERSPSEISDSDAEGIRLAEKAMGLESGTAETKAPRIDTKVIINDAFQLEDADKERIEEILCRDSAFDHYDAIVCLIREIVSHQEEFHEFDEIITITEKVQAEFIKSGQLKYAAVLLKHLKEIRDSLDESNSNRKERINEALAVAAGREKLGLLAHALNRDETIEPEELHEYLDFFGWEALLVITDLLGELQFRKHREALCDYLVKSGKEHVDIISRAVFDRRWYVVRNTVSVLTRIGGDKAYSYLERAVNHEEPRVRIEVARGLSSRMDSRGLKILVGLVWDKDKAVKQAAIESILNFNTELALKAISEVMEDDRFVALNEKNQKMFIIAYSRLGGEEAVDYLVKLAKSWSLFPTQSQEFYRKAALGALVENKSQKAEQALVALSRSLRPGLKKLAATALNVRYNTMGKRND